MIEHVPGASTSFDIFIIGSGAGGGTVAYFFAAFNLVTAGNMCLSGGAVGTIANGAVASRLGVTLTNDEILQLAIPKAPTKLPTNSATLLPYSTR